ncbi:glycerate kinase [Mangrovibacter sp. SLW1]
MDASSQDLAPGALALHALHSLDLSAVNPRCASVEIVLMCDVNNPLTGAQGLAGVCTAKGANPQQVSILDDAVVHFARVVERVSGVDYTGRTGFGAAGGSPWPFGVVCYSASFGNRHGAGFIAC